jgi:hypothetical protein
MFLSLGRKLIKKIEIGAIRNFIIGFDILTLIVPVD